MTNVLKRRLLKLEKQMQTVTRKFKTLEIDSEKV